MSKEEEIIKRLDVLIHLILKQQKEIPVTKKNMENLVRMFHGIGLDDYKSIAKIIGAKNPKSVGNILTRLKGTKRKKIRT
jgi:hypothetical protein